ncbi:hypothetical protein Tco_0793484 [Tanacetum coccineum]
MPMDDLLQAVPKLISRIDSLEIDLKQTKLTMGNAIVKLVKKVKKLEGFLKMRNLVLIDSEDEDLWLMGRKSQDDPQDSSIQGLVTPPTTKGPLTGREIQREKRTNKGKNVSQAWDFSRRWDACAEMYCGEIKDKVKGKAPIVIDETPIEVKLGLIRAKLEANAVLSKSIAWNVNFKGEDFAKENGGSCDSTDRSFSKGTWKDNSAEGNCCFEEVMEEFDKPLGVLVKLIESFQKDDEITKEVWKRRKQMERKGGEEDGLCGGEAGGGGGLRGAKGKRVRYSERRVVERGYERQCGREMSTRGRNRGLGAVRRGEGVKEGRRHGGKSFWNGRGRGAGTDRGNISKRMRGESSTHTVGGESSQMGASRREAHNEGRVVTSLPEEGIQGGIERGAGGGEGTEERLNPAMGGGGREGGGDGGQVEGG